MIIGITGGVGCGKSTVLKYVQEVCKENNKDCQIYLLDDEAKKLQEPGMPMFEAIVVEFGSDIVSEDGSIDRAKLASMTFGNEENMKRLNNTTLPYVLSHIDEILSKVKPNDLVFFESAILLDTPIKEKCDEIWFIHADRDLRKVRLKVNRGYSEERIRNMFKSQRRDIYYKNRCDLVIHNNYMDVMQKDVKEALEKWIKNKT